jgi:hypothetical protein
MTTRVHFDRVILVGEMWRGSYGYCFSRALEAWGIDRSTVAIPSLTRAPLLMRPLLFQVNRAVARTATLISRWHSSSALRRLARSGGGRWVTLVVGVHPIDPQALERLHAHGPLVLFFNDDLETRRGRPARWWNAARPLLAATDLLVTQRPHREAAIRKYYSGEILFQDFAYMEMFHRPYAGPAPRHWACDVGFVGNFDPDRLAPLERLAEAGLEVGVWGVRWPPRRGIRRNGYLATPQTPRALAASSLALGLVRHNNFDYQVMRTFEVPACAGFLLAERTPDHQRLFQEGVEAEFFGDNEELVSKARYYARETAARERIAAAGHRRITSAPNTVADRLREVLWHPLLAR